MSDDVPGENSQYGNIEQIKADIIELKQAVANLEEVQLGSAKVDLRIADLEARVEPLQNVTNALNVVAQLEMDADGLRQRTEQTLRGVGERINSLAAKMLEMDGRYATRLGALEQRLDAMDKMGKVGQ